MSAQKKRVLIRGPILTRSGYGEQARFAYRALKTRPDLFTVYLAPTNWGSTSWLVSDDPERHEIDELIKQTTIHHANCQKQGLAPFDVSIQVTIPQEWEKIAPKNIGYTAGTETTLISLKWIEHTRNVDRIIAVSEHTKAAFDNTEYEGRDPHGNHVTARNEVPIDVVNFPAKAVDPEQLDFEPETDFNFLVVAQWSERKNMDNTLQAFLRGFHDQEVGMIFKTNLAKNCLLDREHCMTRLKAMLNNYDSSQPLGGRKCKVYLLHGNFTDEQMYGLYQHPKIKALVNAAHGEGFGLPIFEAAQSGLPVIAPNWGGQKDFMNAEVITKKKGKKDKKRVRFLGAPVDYHVKQIQKDAVWENILIPESSWCYPIERSLMNEMKNVQKNYGRYISDAKKLKAHIAENFSEEKQNAEFVESVLKTIETNKAHPTSVISL